MRRESLEAILLDLDGTLLDSHDVLFETYASFLRQHDREPSAREFAELDGPSIPEIVARLRHSHALTEQSPALETSYRAALAREYPAAPGAAGADDLLPRLTERFRLGLVTSAPSELAKQALRRRGWADRFEIVITGDDGPAKPAPALYLAALAGLALAPQEALAVEDSVNGVLAAAAAGLPVVGVSALKERRLHLKEAGAVRVVSDLGAVAGLVL